MRILFVSGICYLLFANTAFASEAGGHADPVAPVLLALVFILVVAKIGSEIFERLGQPAVLGELLGGVVLGNLILLNPAWVAVLGVIAPFILGFGASWLFIKELPAELAAIVGAFAAGLILEEVHFRGFREEIHLEQLIKPIATFLVPIFFVLMGVQVRLETFADLAVLGVAAGLTIAAIIGKQICGFGVVEKGLDRITVGVGMIPRGEVGLIFASIGKGLKVIDDATFSAVVIMVIVTTLVTPPVLKLTLARWEKRN